MPRPQRKGCGCRSRWLRVPREEAAATLYVLYSPQVADMLIGDYGWSPERYERWLARMILPPCSRDKKRDDP